MRSSASIPVPLDDVRRLAILQRMVSLRARPRRGGDVRSLRRELAALGFRLVEKSGRWGIACLDSVEELRRRHEGGRVAVLAFDRLDQVLAFLRGVGE